MNKAVRYLDNDFYILCFCLVFRRRPLYQYEGANPPTSTGGGPIIQSGFPTAAAINLSVKCIAAASTGMKPLPLPLPLPLTRSPGTVSVMDLSTSSVTSTSPQVRLYIHTTVVLHLTIVPYNLLNTRYIGRVEIRSSYDCIPFFFLKKLM